MTQSFIESPRFPEDISYGASGGPKFNTDVIIVQSGFEKRNINWIDSIHEYDVAHGLKTPYQIQDLKKFFLTVKGRGIPFRFKDWADFQTLQSDGIFDNGIDIKYDGTSKLYLFKKYQLQTNDLYYRRINKPAFTTVKIYKNNVLLVENTNYTIDYANGFINILTPNKSLTITAISKAIEAVVTSTNHGLTVNDKVSFSGVVGMVEINNLKATVTSVIDLNNFTVNINSTLFTTYTSGGLVKMFLAQSDILEWSGEFDVPVRFNTDSMKVNIDDYNVYSWGQIPVVEVRI